jgi:hypothetical protein
MLSDEDIAKLCHGRIVKARVYNSAGTDATEPHFGIMLDSDEDIREHDSFYLVMISHNRDIDDKFVVPVPARTGMTGYVICLFLGTKQSRAACGDRRGHIAETDFGRIEAGIRHDSSA